MKVTVSTIISCMDVAKLIEQILLFSVVLNLGSFAGVETYCSKVRVVYVIKCLTLVSSQMLNQSQSKITWPNPLNMYRHS